MNGFDLRDAFTIEKGGSEITALYLGSDLIWPKTNFEEDYLTIVSLYNNVEVRFTSLGFSVDIQVSTDKANWTTYSSSKDPYTGRGTTIATLNKYQKLYLKGNNPAYAVKQGNYVNLSYIEIVGPNSSPTIGWVNIQGNIMSMIYGDNFIGQTTLTEPYAFCGLFGGGTGWSSQDASVYPINSIKHLVLPATTLTPYCYAYMFYWKPLLKSAPTILPATTLAEGCYYNMFGFCDALINTPKLPATTLADYCYTAMFQSCTSLTTAPILPAPTVPASAYELMFLGCISLNYITMLATQLSTNALNNWVVNVAPTGTFIKAPQQNSLPIGDSGIPTGWVTQNAPSIYISYSANGTVTANMAAALPGMEVELTVTPDSGYVLSSLTVLDSYQHSITVTNNKFTMPETPVSISAAFVSIPHTITILQASHGTCTANKYSASVGEIVTLTVTPDTNYSVDDLYALTSNSEATITNNQFTMPPDDVTITCTFANFDEEYLTIESLSDNNTIRWHSHDEETNTVYSIQYSTDKINWNTVTCTGSLTYTDIATIDKYEKIYFSNMSLASIAECIICSKDAKVKGNIMSLIDRSTFTNLTDLSIYNTSNIFNGMFRSMGYYNSYITDAKDLKLPATVLSERCYSYMFKGCNYLTSTPTLPATTLAERCYAVMFQSCSSLTTTPTLPATTLADYCYISMFSSCLSLTTAPALPATTLTEGCYANMFNGCSSLTTAPALPATTLTYGCYYGMFLGCSSLTTAPALPATTLTEGCYTGMFQSCSSLVNAPALPATTLADYCYYFMFAYCDSLVNAPALPATTLTKYCYASMFNRCISLRIAPDLLAPEFASYCYEEMFKDCQLTYLKCLIKSPSNVDGQNNLDTKNWGGGSQYGTFVKWAYTVWGRSDSPYYSGYPYNFTVVDAHDINTTSYVNNGTITANTEYAVQGETVTLTLTPDAGYSIPSSYQVIKNDGSHDPITVTNNTFTMPDCNVIVECSFTALSYNINIGQISHGTVTTSPSGSAYTDQTVTLTSTPNTGYELNTLTVVDASSNPVTVTNNTFTMPPSNVSVSATFSQISYNVNITSGITGGTVTSNKNTAHSGEVVTLTVTPDSGYNLDTLTVVGATSGSSVIVDSNNRFVMPAEAVTVNATFLVDYSNMYFTIESLENNNTITFTNDGMATKTISYSSDKTNWSSISSVSNSTVNIATLNTGDKLYIKGTNNVYGQTWGHRNSFGSTGNYNVYGNIMSLIYGDNFVGQTTIYNASFYFLFYQSIYLIDASHLILPATNITSQGYAHMFHECYSLTGAPALPSVNVGYQGYESMFRDCTSLTTAPVLPATTPESLCYNQMFDGCTSLNYVEVYATSTSNYFTNWLRNVAATGTFKKLAYMTTFPSGASGIPSGWTVVNV